MHIKSRFIIYLAGALGGFCLAQPGAAQSVAAPLPPLGPDARFAAFIYDFRSQALAAGISAAVYDASMTGLMRDPDIEARDLNQPEFSRPIWSYLDSAVSDKRISQGQLVLQSYSTALANIQSRYGVPKEVLVAIWGMESNYGSAMGSFNIFDALATLAYDGPRTAYARKELLDALTMEQQENLDPAQMTASWAGAFGQTQFVPSAFFKYAVDGDGDGKRDLWHSVPDALASTANLLASSGWIRGGRCEQEVTLPAGFAYELADGETQKTLGDWRSLGVTLPSGAALSHADTEAAIFLPAGARGPAFLVYDNFKAVLLYNNSANYALAVCYLAHRLSGGVPIFASWPRGEQPLSRDDRLAMQMDLKTLGFDPGDLDGLLGRHVRAQLRLYQKARGLPADGFPTQSLLQRLTQDVAAKPD
ncbi:MAG TPA: lytic murein transglycosylase [Rhizomicrobium sp.]|jgi:membrane-bound lytic murein transglycosylase B